MAGHTTETECGGQTASRGRSLGKQEEPLRNPRREARAKAGVEARPKAREKASHTTCAEGLDTPRGCAPVKDGLTTWSRTHPNDKTPMNGCWTEEDDETLQLEYHGGEPSPGLRDAFCEAGWTVNRKSRNRHCCSRRRGCFDKRGTIL